MIKYRVQFSESLRLHLGFSNQLAMLLFLFHSSALLLLFPLTLSIMWKIAIGIAISISAIYSTYRHLLYSAHPLQDCLLHRQGIKLKNGEEARLSPRCYVHVHYVILWVIRQNGRLCAYIIFSDALDAFTFRHLRVYLRHI